ncbi:CHAT domain-containing protein [Nostoc sp. FACHB-152]|uniref:CHAT domain-containing protein n=1 Tax=Nostoc sp. FACHB-152 TaxID=2692837 RepID=UPI001687F69D|nr:CHAT domain-containing protein [Nostoc sp. FACHB-152]MBD2449256.1 CHAT domain-containing protein [Nostoc sp. FACHB-152]
MNFCGIKKILVLITSGAIAYGGVYPILPVQAQSITPTPNNDTNTIINTNGNRIDISGGTLSADQINLFHSFQKFGLDTNQIANFLSNPNIKNILGRIKGGDPSMINGLIQVSGGNSNLFLLNPSGFVFGPNASLNLPADFVASTANSIGFGTNWFHALADNNYATLVGTPTSFNFNTSQPGSIVNFGNLAVANEANLRLIGGTVVSTGQLSAPGGNITIAAVPGENLLRISQSGNLLSLEIPTNASASGNISVATLPKLLINVDLENTGGLTVNSNQQVQLTNTGLPINSGDVVATGITAGSATLSAAHNLTLPASQLNTKGDLNLLARDTVRVRDTATNPFLAQSGSNLYIQGNQGIDILALNHPPTPFVSSNNLSLVSDGIISGDAHFASGGQFKILNLSGEPGNFVSLYDPIIRANGDVTFGNYTGAALKVETTASITGGNITITSPDTSGSIPNTDPDFTALTTSQAVILRAGLASVTPVNFPSNQAGTNFTTPGTPLLPPGSIQVGNINTSSTTAGINGGPISFSATGNITTGNLNSSAIGTNNGGAISLSTTGGSITIANSIDSSGNAGGNITFTGPVNLANGATNITTGSGAGDISFSNTLNGASNLTLNAGTGNITLGTAVGNTTQLTGLTVTAANTNVGNNITTTGTQQYTGQVNLTGTNAKTFTTTNNDIGFSSTVNGASNLNLNAGTGDITLSGAVGNTTALTGLSVTAANTNVGNNINTTGTQQFNSQVNLTGTNTKTFTTTNNNITFANQVTGAGGLTLNAGTGTINVGNNINTTGTQQFNSQVNLTGTNAKTFTTTNNDITFANQVIATNSDFTVNAGTGEITFNNVNAGTNNLTLTADEINFNGGNNSVTGTGNLVLQPSTPSLNVAIGAASDSGTSTLDLTSSKLSALQPRSESPVEGFSSITIGRDNSSGIFNINPINFFHPITIQSPEGQLNTQGTISTNNNNITLNGNVNLIADTEINAGSGNINFEPIHTINGARNLTLSGSNITLGGAVGNTTALTGLTVTAANDLNIPNNITTTGTQQYSGQVNLTGANAKTFTTTNNNITFDNQVIATNSDFTVNAGTGEITFNNVNAGTNNLILTADEINFNGGTNSITGTGNLVLQPSTPSLNMAIGAASDSSSTTTLDLTSSELSALTDGFSSITIGRNDGSGAITVTNPVTFQDPVTIQATAGAGSITAGNIFGIDNASITLLANQNITTGNIETQSGDISVTSSSGQINPGNVNSDSDSNDTAGNISFTGSVNLANGATNITTGSAAGNINFSNTVNGASNLTLNAGTGNITLGGAIGNTTPLTGLTVTSANTNIANNITTTGNQTFNSQIQLTGNATLSAGNNIDFNNTINGSSDLTVNTRGNVSFRNEIGGTTRLNSLNTNAANIAANNINTTGNISLAANNTVTTSNLITQGGDITVTSQNGNITTQTLNTSAGNTAANNINTTGNISLAANNTVTTGDLITQGGDITVTSQNGNITTKKLDSNNNDRTNNGGNITLQSGGENPVKIQAGEINSSSRQGNGGNVTITVQTPRDKYKNINDFRDSIVVQSINAEGRNFGGDVDIKTNGFFRAEGQFNAKDSPAASISTIGGVFGNGGTVKIDHGGDSTIPFSIGDPKTNGTAARITTEANFIDPLRGFTNSETIGSIQNRGNIQIITQGQVVPGKDEQLPNQVVINNTPSPVASAIVNIEDTETSLFEQKLNLGRVRRKSQQEIIADLKEIQNKTRIKTGLVYVEFSSESYTLNTAKPKEDIKDSDPLVLLMVSPDGQLIRHQVPGVTRGNFKKIADKFYQEVSLKEDLDSPPDLQKLKSTSYKQSAQQLYKWLISPIEVELKNQGIDNLMFVMRDASLRSLPIAALMDEQEKFLIQKYGVTIIPTFSLINPKYVPSKNLEVLAMGAETFDPGPDNSNQITELLAAPIEAETIVNQVWQGRGKILINKDFTLPRLEKERNPKEPFGIIHLATHAVFTPGDPLNSYIQLYDSKLTLNNVRKLGWNNPQVDLLILSACQTAYGDEDSQLGLAGSAVKTGVKSVVASLWQVSDTGTLGLMTEFHRQLQKQPIKVEALRQAQLAMISGAVGIDQDGKNLITDNNSLSIPLEKIAVTPTEAKQLNLKHPFFWASFTMIGSPW